MAKVEKGIRIERTLYEFCNDIFDELGIPASAGINAFFKYIVREQGIPFAENFGIYRAVGETTTRCINVDAELFDSVKEILVTQNIPVSHAVNTFYHAIAETKGIPFELRLTEGRQHDERAGAATG